LSRPGKPPVLNGRANWREDAAARPPAIVSAASLRRQGQSHKYRLPRVPYQSGISSAGPARATARSTGGLASTGRRSTPAEPHAYVACTFTVCSHQAAGGVPAWPEPRQVACSSLRASAEHVAGRFGRICDTSSEICIRA